jgi:uncharacterized protein involved in type VI secretion and phage assembly
MPEGSNKYYGKYRGTVVNNIDPEQRARVMVQVPDVLGMNLSSWATPCVPLAGTQVGVYVVPPVGAGVWVEFEQGNSDYPIWVGGWWGSAAEVPPLALAATPGVPNILLQTTGQNTIVMSDVPGGMGITIKTRTGAMIVINDTGILLSNGKGATILMSGPSVTINNGAMVIT